MLCRDLFRPRFCGNCPHVRQQAASCARRVVHTRAVAAGPASKVTDPWKLAEDMMFKGVVVEGTITGCNKRGIYVQLADLKGFMPYSKIDPERLRVGHKGDLSYLVGQHIKARIVQVDTSGPRKDLVLSERQARLTAAVEQLEEGATVTGSVTRLEDYGAFVSLLGPDGKPTGVQGLLHKSEMSWGMVMTVDEVVSLGQQLQLKVLSVDTGRCRVALSLRQLTADPTKETMDQLQWTDTNVPLPEIAPIVQMLLVTGGIEDVTVTRVAEVKHTVTQDLELYFTKQEEDGGFTLVARWGRMLQELRVTTGMSRDDMKKAITRALRMVK